MDTRYFYNSVEEIPRIHKLADSMQFQKIPSDWYVLITDVKGSTNAIESGKYKDVNMLGALSIISILNIDKKIDIPFVFGGDGAFILVPKVILYVAKQALLAVQKIATSSYGLDLRIGVVSIADLEKFSKEILIAKLRITDTYAQAITKGGGLEYCDYLLKDTNDFFIEDSIDENFELNLDGLECRWEAIPSPKQETISLLLKAKDEESYEIILEDLDSILGSTAERTPITADNLHLTYSDKNLQTEASIYHQNYFFKKILILKYKLINLIGDYLINKKVDEWEHYKNRVCISTDTEKFDDILRMTVAVDKEQSKALVSYLNGEVKKKKIVYGIHKTDSALITCLIFERHGKHIHFVDASNGGYAIAAKMMKQQLLDNQILLND